MTFVTATSSNQDHHCGWYYIAPATTVTVKENKQMVTFGGLINDGILINDGQVISEP
jgi:hypothetical protein